MTIPWILITIIILFILFAVIAVFATSKKKIEPNYYAFFWIGLIWLIFGLPMNNWPMWSLGLVFLIAGLVNKNKWKNNQVAWKHLDKNEKKIRMFIIVILGLLVVGGLVAYLSFSKQMAQCTLDSDCETPMEYLVQSNCPFGSACIEGSCKVVCPLFFHDPNPSISKSYPFECKRDADCNCEERVNSIGCVCHKGNCLSVEN